MKNANTRLLIGLGALGIVFLVVTVLQTWQWTRDHTNEMSDQQARLALEFDMALRTYVGNFIRPEMEKRVEPDQFVPEAMSTSFVARSVFDGVRATFPDYILRFPSTNPRNPVNMATASEREIIRYFEDNKTAETWSGLVDQQGTRYYARAIPRRFEARCLKCHGRPEQAPASLVERYGRTAGFGRSAGEVSIDLVGIPVEKIQSVANAKALHHMLAALATSGLFIAGIGLLIRLNIRQQQRTNLELRRASDQANAMAAEAEAANCTKSEFLANMSHEIRTPMTAILGYTDLVAESLDCCTVCPAHSTCEVRTTNRENMQTIRRNGEHLLSLINDILDLSKIEAEKMTTEQVACSPHQVVADVASLVRGRAESKGLEFYHEFVGPIPETIRTDPLRLRQILINLVGNAIKFTQDGGVRLLVRLVAEDGPPRMQFDVIDTGVGLMPEQTDRIFQLFSQADTSTTRQFGGTGLGLVISKRLAKMLGGDVVMVESQPGIGTRFRATVATGPLDGVRMIEGGLNEEMITVQGCTAEPPPPAAQAKLLDGLRILLAEDGPDNQRLISQLLKKAGAEITVVENGREAVDKALGAMIGRRETDPRQPFDVILMDMMMPEMDGYEATERLRTDGYRGPIIALTAHAMAADRNKCLEAGCDAYATKPVDRRELIELIARYLPQQKTAQTAETIMQT